MCGIKYKDCECCLEHTNIKNDLIECKVYFAVIATKRSLMKT